ncbi:MAG: ribosome small subunit-dependent GTPase A [Aureispira sp.]|nr:ribosome small subunit-dependent GTPase A [Aureispira sp.]
MKGTITKSTGSWYMVRLDSDEVLRCSIKGKFRLKGVKLTNPIAVGDSVEVEQGQGMEDGMGIITKLHPRRNYVLRQSTRKRHYMHMLACNIDQAFLVTTIAHPMLKPGFIDRFLLTTATHDIPTYIIVNKADAYDEGELEMYGGLSVIYGDIGYKTLLVSAEQGDGIDKLRTLLKDKRTLVCGHSGVGKSSLVNAVQPNLELFTQEVSDYSGKGMHTTTFAEMYNLDFGGELIDTPGIKELGFINMEPMDVAHNFKEFFEHSKNCKFNNCMHLNEPHCAVKNAIEEGYISPLRYQNYLGIMEEVMGQNYWERKTDW